MAVMAGAGAPGLWRRTPPAVFPPIMGLFGLGLAWRRGVNSFGLPDGIAEAILGAVTALYLFCLLAYLAKFLRRPAVLVEDLRVLPGRAGVGAMVLCLYLVAAVALPYGPGLARSLLWVAVVVHAAMLVVLIRVFATGPAEQRRVTPVWHLNFVGFILAGLTAPAVGETALAWAVLWVTGFIAVLIWAIGARQLRTAPPPAPLRPLLSIHLAPAAMLGVVALGVGFENVAQIFAVIAAVMLALLIIGLRWITAAGFSPLWGAFTFPLAATSSLWIAIGGVWSVPGGIALIAATPFVPWIAARVLQLWAKGVLAAKTNAATA
ncbi:tellurium resistance protein [Ostreiculturibacter nitratireducens]|uniref:SLAC1 family transporter n=1 Tax=Ostreiculturibacter nitratireducens TaxID=3075226 RepID=UPI0031B62FC9